METQRCPGVELGSKSTHRRRHQLGGCSGERGQQLGRSDPPRGASTLEAGFLSARFIYFIDQLQALDATNDRIEWLARSMQPGRRIRHGVQLQKRATRKSTNIYLPLQGVLLL